MFSIMKAAAHSYFPSQLTSSSIEWQTTSPPKIHCFVELPISFKIRFQSYSDNINYNYKVQSRKLSHHSTMTFRGW